MNHSYNYAIIKKNYPELERERTLIDSRYLKSKKYAMIVKGVHKDGSENIYFIRYSSKLEELQEIANGFPSWYNYPMSLYKEMQGNILPIN